MRNPKEEGGEEEEEGNDGGGELDTKQTLIFPSINQLNKSSQFHSIT